MKILINNMLCPIHAQNRAKALKADHARTIHPGYDWVIFPYPDPRLRPLVDQAKHLGIKTCAYWVGSDVLQRLSPMHFVNPIPEFDLHVTVHGRLQKELAGVGINAHVVHPPVREIPQLSTQVLRPRVVVYMPNTTKRVYDFYRNYRIIEACRFPTVWYGGLEPYPVPPGSMNVGRISQSGVTELLRKSTMLLRLTKHDGFPNGIIEAKLLGKQVVSTYPYPGCLVTENDDQIIATINNEANHKPDTHNRQWYLENCSPSAFAKNFNALLEANK